MSRLFGWDIGGAHLKAAVLDESRRRPRLVWRLASYEIWKGREALAVRLRRMLEEIAPGRGASPAGARHAVTLTAELSDVFLTRDAGVRFVLSACRRALGPRIVVLDHRGRLLSSTYYRPLEILTVAALIYFVLAFPCTVAARVLELRLARARH